MFAGTVSVVPEQQIDPNGVRLLQLSTGISSTIFGFQNLSFPIYLSAGFIGFDTIVIGLMFTVSQVIGAAFAIPMGILADRWGRKKFVVAARLLQISAFFAFIFLTDFVPLLAGMILLQVGMAVSTPPFNALLADKTPIERRNSAFSRNYVALSMGATVGSALCLLPPYLRDSYGFGSVASYRPLFIIMALIASASLAVIVFVREAGRPRNTLVKDEKRAKAVTFTSGGRIAKYTLTLVMIQVGAGMVVQLFSLWLRIAFGVAEDQLAPLYVVINLTMGLGYFLANGLAAWAGTVRSIVLTQFLATILLFALPNIPDFRIVGIVYIIRTAVMNMSNPILTSFICSIVPVDERATALSISNSTGSIARAVGPALGGGLMVASLSLPFYICGTLYASSTLLFYLFFKSTKPQC
jgi:MFS family permease